MSATTPRALPHWAQVPHRAVCSARWSSHCWPTTALRRSAPTTSASLPDDTSVVGLLSNNDETHYREEVAQLAEWYGANNLSLNVGKTKEVVIDLRRNSVDHPPTDHRQLRLWRVSAVLNSWGCTSQRISPGSPTPCHSPRRHNSPYTFSTGRKEQVSLPPTHPHHFLQGNHWECADQLHHCLVRELLCSRPSTGQWTQLQKSSVPLSPPSWIFSLHDAPAKPIVSWRTPPILPTVSSSSYHQEDRSGASEPAPPDCSTAFSPGCESPELNSPRPLSETRYKPPTSWNMDHLTPTPPQPYHIAEKNCQTFFVQFQVCYTQVSGPVQATCSNTLSSICTRHFSHVTVCT